jgi:hypothetical protein
MMERKEARGKEPKVTKLTPKLKRAATNPATLTTMTYSERSTTVKMKRSSRPATM